MSAGRATELEKSDSRRWFLQCPSCGSESIAQWQNVSYKDRRYPVYVTPCCGAALEGIQFRQAVAAGRWKSTKEPMVEGTVGFHLDCFLSPFETLRTVTRAWQRASSHSKQTGSAAEIISFQCGRLCLPYRPTNAGGVTPEAIRDACREDYNPRHHP